MRENPKNIKKLLISVLFVGCAHHIMDFSQKRLSLRLAFDLLKLESVLLFCIRVPRTVDLFEEHHLRPNPERAVLVELSVDHNVLSRLRITGNTLYKIIIALKMPIYSPYQNFAHKSLPAVFFEYITQTSLCQEKITNGACHS